MVKNGVRKLPLAIVLFTLAAPILRAQSSTQPPNSAQATASDDGVTGGDPEPTSPTVVEIILDILLVP
jgi:hypothetical protein